MSESAYTVRVDRSQGIIDISGPDKDWISEQLSTLMPILEAQRPPETRKRDDAGGKAPVNPETRKAGTRSRRTNSSSGKVNPNLSEQLSSEMKTKLDEYLKERTKNASDAQSQAAVIATFLHDELSWPEVTADDLFTVYSDMGLKIPVTRNALSNAQKRKGYFSAPSDGKYRVSHKGLNFARHDSKA